MSARVYAVLAFTIAAPLAYLYLAFLSWLISNGVLPGANYIEMAIVVTQLIRLVLVLAVRRLRVASAAQIWDIFALEAFSLPVLFSLYFLFGDPYMVTLVLTILAAWPSALLCVTPVYVIYRLASSALRDGRLTSVVPATVALFTLFSFISYVVSLRPAPGGLAALSSLLFSTLLQMRTINITSQVVFASVPLYLSIAIYSTIQGGGVSSARNSALLLVTLGTLIAIGLAAFAAYIAVFPSLVFGVPGMLLVTIMWWMSRAR
jgi:hypothetical protein